MTRHDGSPSVCPAPLETTVLADYWLALLSESEEEAVDVHLFECDVCGDRLRAIIRMSEGLRAIARSGSLRVVVDDGFVRHAAESGQRVRQYDFEPGQPVQCTIAESDALLVARLAVNLVGAERVDVSFHDPQGVERARLNDVPFHADARHLVFQESAPFAKAAPTSGMIARVHVVGADGQGRVVGEYFFEHTRTIPGPPGWEW